MAMEEAQETNANSGVLTPNTAQNSHWTPETGTSQSHPYSLFQKEKD